MYRIYAKLRRRKDNATLSGYLSSSVDSPFELADKRYATVFYREGMAIEYANKWLRTLNLGYFQSVTVRFVEG